MRQVQRRRGVPSSAGREQRHIEGGTTILRLQWQRTRIPNRAFCLGVDFIWNPHEMVKPSANVLFYIIVKAFRVLANSKKEKRFAMLGTFCFKWSSNCNDGDILFQMELF